MRIVVASFRISMLLVFLSLPCFVGCSGGSSEPKAFTKESGPPEEGMVWNEQGEYWEWANQGGGDDGYDYESGYQGATNDGYADNDGSASDDVPDQGYGDDSTNDSDAGSPDGSDAYGANDYGTADNIDRPADLDEQRAAAARDNNGGYGDGYGSDAYASANNSAPGGAGGGSGVYKETIEPILSTHCYSCHGGGPRGSKGDLELHNPSVLAASNTIKAFDPDDSELFIRVSLDSGDKHRMPPKGPGLSSDEVAAIESWIKSGASYGNTAGGDGGGYGNPYASSSNRNQDADDPYGDDSDGANDGDGPPQPPKNLAEAASVAFQRGNDVEAMNQLFAQTLVRNSEAAKELLEKYRYLPAKRRAKLAVRWGIGVIYKPLHGFKGAPRPPGIQQDIPNDDDDGDYESEEYADMRFQDPVLDYYTGDFGDELLIRLQLRIEEGFYGEVLREELGKKLAGNDDDFDDYGDDNGGYGRSSGGNGSDGGYGGARDGGSSDKPDGERIAQILPGVTMLGEADQRTLLERAEEEEVDLVVIFDVRTNPLRRQRLAESTFRARLFDAKTQAILATTGKIENLDLQKARAEDPDDKTIIDEMDKLFAFADKGGKLKDKTIRAFKVTEFPTTTSEKAKAGVMSIVKRLLAETEAAPLAKLSEVRFYESRGLLKDTHAAAAYNRIVPDHAAKLATVTDENEVRTLLSEWLVTEEFDDADDDDEDSDSRPRRSRRGFR